MELKSMVDFVLEQGKLEFIPIGENFGEERSDFCLHKLDRINAYANFLKQPLTLSMFVPCGDDGEVLGEPMSYKKYLNVSNTMSGSDILLCQQYQQAKERCLFEGFEAVNDELINNGVLFWVGKFDGKETIENCISSNLTITPSAINQITTTR